MARIQSVPTGDRPYLRVTAAGNLAIRGWDQPTVELQGASDDQLDAATEGQNGDYTADLRIRLSSNAALRVPRAATLEIERAAGNVTLDDVASLLLREVAGNLRIRQAGPITGDTVHGNVSLYAIQGGCRLQNVSGALHAVTVSEELAVERVSGNLRAEDIGGNLLAPQVHGSAKLRLALAPGQTCRVRADGAITCRVPADTGASVSLQSGDRIRVRGLPAPEANAERSLSFTLGDGAATLALEARGSLRLKAWEADDAEESFDPDLVGDLAERIAVQVESQVESVARQLDEKLSQMGGGDELAGRVQEKVQAALRQAEKKLNEALRSAEQRSREADRRMADMEARRRSAPSAGWYVPPAPPAPRPPRPKRPDVSDEERLLILKMVEDGKLSVEQAEQLLKALRG